MSIKAFNFFSEARCFQSCSWVYIIFSPTAGYSHPGNHIREGHSVEYVVLMVSLDPLSVIECCFYHFLFEYFLPLWAFMFFFFFQLLNPAIMILDPRTEPDGRVSLCIRSTRT